MYILFRQLNFRHQFIGYDLQHFFQLGQVIGAEPLFGTLHNQMQVRIADVIVINVLLGRPQAVFPLIGGGLDALHIAFFDQGVDLLSCVGGGKIHHVAELRNRGFPQCHDDFHAERFYRRQRGFTVFKTVEDLFIKMQLEFCVYLPKCLIQHGENPPVG